MSQTPPLPAIEGDMMLDVFTHRSVRGDPEPNSEYGDTDRLAELGSSVLKMAVMYSLFRKKPHIPAAELSNKQDELLSDAQISQWLATYGLRSKVRTSTPRADLETPAESQFLFNSYVGAAYLQQGLSVVLSWIGQLVDPVSNPPSLPGGSSSSRSPPPYSASSSAQPVQPTFPSLPTMETSSSVNILALFNQTCAQRKLSLTWHPESQGPPHDPRWIVRCNIDGVLRGTGTGRNQKAAKEEAARKAFQVMGWGSIFLTKHPLDPRE